MHDLNNILQFVPSGVRIQQGKLLISEPFANDSYFKRSVVLIANYDEEGALGLILNKKTNLHIHDITDQFGTFNAEVYIGGPVQTENLFFLHSRGDIIPDSEELIKGVYWGGDFDILKEHIESGAIQSNEIRFFLGYSGWSKKQLQNELDQNNWLVNHIKSQDIFSQNPEDLWKIVISNMGENYLYWLNFPVNPQYN